MERRSELERLAAEFATTFNAHDLDAALSCFADGAVYDEMHGPIRTGKPAIREALEGLFARRFGAMRFQTEDMFVDPAAGKVMVSWVLRLTALNGGPAALRGLDLLHYDNGLIVRKLTYCKARVPLYRDP